MATWAITKAAPARSLSFTAASLKPNLFPAGGEAGKLLRDQDWGRTPLGSPEAWPQALTTLVRVMLNAGQPMFIAWGPERILLYNDRYVPLLGKKHPGALGRPFNEAWSEILDDIAPIMDRAAACEAKNVPLTLMSIVRS